VTVEARPNRRLPPMTDYSRAEAAARAGMDQDTLDELVKLGIVAALTMVARRARPVEARGGKTASTKTTEARPGDPLGPSTNVGSPSGTGRSPTGGGPVSPRGSCEP